MLAGTGEPSVIFTSLVMHNLTINSGFSQVAIPRCKSSFILHNPWSESNLLNGAPRGFLDNPSARRRGAQPGQGAIALHGGSRGGHRARARH